MARKVYLCFHHHSDLVWRRTKEGYDKVREEQILHNLGLLERYTEYRFCFAQSNIMDVFLSQHPEYENKIKKLVEEGKIYFVGGMVSIPDTNLILGESIVRNILVGREYYKRNFGKDIEIAWFMDAFGMSGQLPQILKKSGFKYLYPGRTPGLPENYGTDFIWKGIDGTEIITAREKGSIQTSSHVCNLPIVYKPEERMEISLNELLKNKGDVLSFYATEEGLIDESILEIAKKHKEITISQPIDYYRKLYRKRLKVYKGEFNPEFSGCYTTRIEIKKANRECEFSILNAEKLNAISSILSNDFYDKDFYNYLWEKLSICQFHDGICGCHIDSVYNDLMRDMKEIKDMADTRTFYSLSKIIPERKREKIVLFNTNFWERDEIVSLQGKRNISVYENGKNIKTQNYKGSTYFRVKVPPFGYKVLDFKYGSCKEKVLNKKSDIEKFKYENEYYSLKTDKNQIMIKEKFLKTPVLKKNFGEILFREDNGDLWKENFQGIIMGSEYENEEIKEIRMGDVFTSILIEGSVKKGEKGFLHGGFWDGFESLEWSKEFIFPEGTKNFYLRLKLEWRGKNTKVMICFPTEIDPIKGKGRYEIPFGFMERPPYYEVNFKYRKNFRLFSPSVYTTSKGDWPALTWVDYYDGKKGLGLANTGTPAHQLKEGNIFVSLLRSPTGKSSAFTPDVGSYDNGSHIYWFSFLPHQGEKIKEVVKLGYNLNNPVIASFSCTDAEKERSFISVDNAVVSSFKMSEKKDGYILRIFETEGKSKRVKIKVNFPFKKVYQTDMLERVEKEVDIKKIDIKPFEIKTIFIERQGG